MLVAATILIAVILLAVFLIRWDMKAHFPSSSTEPIIETGPYEFKEMVTDDIPSALTRMQTLGWEYVGMVRVMWEDDTLCSIRGIVTVQGARVIFRRLRNPATSPPFTCC